MKVCAQANCGNGTTQDLFHPPFQLEIAVQDLQILQAGYSRKLLKVAGDGIPGPI